MAYGSFNKKYQNNKSTVQVVHRLSRRSRVAVHCNEGKYEKKNMKFLYFG